MYGILLIAVLVVTGGAIAFIGDRVGSKVGKKKLSLFGLRPRHTSVIVTIVTGVLITTLTFAVLAAASENVRVALFGMERLNSEMRDTQERLTVAGEKLAESEREQRAAGEELKKSKAEVEKMHERQSALEKRAEELALGNEKLEEAKDALTAKNAELSAGNRELSSQNEALAENNKKLEERADALREGLIIMREGDIVFRAGEIIASGVLKGDRPIEEVRADIGQLIALANNTTAQRIGVSDRTSEIWIYSPEYDQAAKMIAEGKDDMIVRIVAAGNLIRGEPVRTSLQLFKNSIVYEKGEFIIARPFKLTGDPREAESIVMSFLKDVNAAAQAKGILPDPISGSVGIMEGTQFFDIVQAIVPLNGTIILSAYARNDTDAMGPLRLNLKLEGEPPQRED